MFSCRWYKHISSYSKELNDLPGVVRSLEQLGLGKSEKKEEKEEEDDDDDVDLFGSDDEEDEEAERIRQERLKVRSRD